MFVRELHRFTEFFSQGLHGFTREMIVHKLDLTIEDMRITGDTAVCTVVYDTQGVMMGQPIAGKFRYLRVWRRFGSELKVIAASVARFD